MNVYNINWNRLAVEMLPIALRKPALLAIVTSMLRPLELLHLDFLNFRAASLYRVRHNSQIVYMESMLNDIFDPWQKRIRIVNTVFKTAINFYEPEENKEVFFFEPTDNKPVIFREQNELSGDGFDFMVFVPPALRPSIPSKETAMITRMRAEIDYYKLYSKNYNILWQASN